MIDGTIIRKTTAAPANGGPHRLRDRLGSLIARLRLCHELQRERAQLLALNERELHDIGISRIDAVREARKPLWRA